MYVLYFIEGNFVIPQNTPQREAESALDEARAATDRLSGGDDWVDIDPPTCAIEPDVAVNEREDRVITAKADVLTRQKLRPALAHDDVAGHDHLAAEFFHTEPFADAVAAVLDAALSFFVSHRKKVKGLKEKLEIIRRIF
jgi:hypothetical protein